MSADNKHVMSKAQAYRARIASLETEAKILRERRATADTQAVTHKRHARQLETHLEQLAHKLEERTVRVRRLEKACKLGLVNLRNQDSDGVYWCLTTQRFDKHLAGTKAPGCRYCRVYKDVNNALEGKDIEDGYSPAVSGAFDIPPDSSDPE